MQSTDRLQAIRKVDKRTASLISSGEVISTLGLAVKELIENSLDANSTSISVDLYNYGVDCIEVSDNGSGIKECDFDCIATRHCTSKIDKFEDLSDLRSFGFRGEALCSLCSLSELTIVTRHITSAVATKLVFTSEGKISLKCPAARQVGTTVTIRELFTNYPVRRKQLIENHKKEFQKLIQLITPYCVGFVDTQIHCRNHVRNKRVDVLCVNKNSSLKGNIIQLFGSNQIDSIQEFIKDDDAYQEVLDEFKINEKIKERQSSIVVSGFISKCDSNSSRSSSDKQFYFVNNRPVEFKRLKKLVNDVYSEICKNQYPFVLLKLEVPRNTIDVNISPDKRSLTIEDEDLILAVVKSSMLKMFKSRSIAYTSDSQNLLFRTASKILKTSHEEQEKVEASGIRIERKRCTSPFDPEFVSEDALEAHTSELEAPSSPPPNSNSPHHQLDESISEDIEIDSFFSSKRTAVDTATDNTVSKRIKANHGTNKPTNTQQMPTFQSAKQLYITDMFPSVNSNLNNEAESNVTSSEDNAQVLEIDCDNTVQNSPSPIHLTEAVEQLNQNECCPQEQRDGNVDVDCSLLDATPAPIVRREIRVNVDVRDIKEKFLKSSRSLSDQSKFKSKLSVSGNDEADSELKSELHKEAFKEMEIIGQFNKGFVIAKYKNDLFIIDQHASDEKFNYEDLCASTVLQSQPLIRPLDLELGAFQESVLNNNLQSFAKSGFKFTFDDNARPGKRAKLTAVPMSKNWVFGKQDIEEMLHEITESGTIPSNYRPSRVKQMLASRACRKSIMIGDDLTTPQMKKLLANMSALCNPWTCAHGRPSVRHLLNQDCVLLDLSS